MHGERHDEIYELCVKGLEAKYYHDKRHAIEALAGYGKRSVKVLSDYKTKMEEKLKSLPAEAYIKAQVLYDGDYYPSNKLVDNPEIPKVRVLIELIGRVLAEINIK